MSRPIARAAHQAHIDNEERRLVSRERIATLSGAQRNPRGVMDDSYDLTKKLTLEKLARAGVFGLVGNLFFWAKDLAGASSDVSPEKQAEAAERIIRAGKENGAKHIRMKVTKEVGAKMQAVEPQSGVSLSGKLGSDGTMELEVEYK